MKPKSIIPICLIITNLCALWGCNSVSKDSTNASIVAANDTLLPHTDNWIHDFNYVLTTAVVGDFFTPPVGSRIYAYTHLAAYEVLRQSDTSYPSLLSKLNNAPTLPTPAADSTYNWDIAAIKTASLVGQKLVSNIKLLQQAEPDLIARFSNTSNAETIKRSLQYGENAAQIIINWLLTDGYIETRTMPRHAIQGNNIAVWKPTPPDYLPAIEPNWGRMRPFALDSAGQFKPPAPAPFDSSKQSAFYKNAYLVYETSKKMGEPQRQLARFWDCNPNATIHEGHLTYAIKRISPGGHWVGIATLAAKQKKYAPLPTAEITALTSLAIADAFISCWDEKYRSLTIRPETYITMYIDPQWQALIQSPPFPEHTSGHSVVSAAAATVLTRLVGDQFAYTDTIEIGFGLAAQSYQSFRQAADSAAISRLYGGIHYIAAIEEGKTQGNQVAGWLLKKVGK